MSQPAGARRDLTAGVAKLDITPADLAGLNPMGGAFTAVHDAIHLRALVLDDGVSEVAILSIDLIEVGDMTAVRRRIEREVGIPYAHVLITATHSHNAPRIGLVSPGALAHDGSPESLVFTETVYAAMIDALRRARASARPARFGVGTGSADVNVNRDEYRAGEWILGHNPQGPSDKTVWVLKFETLTGAPIAVLANYAVHSTVTLGTGELSADLAGAAMRHVERSIGRGVVALWTSGPLGDQNPRASLESSAGDARDAREVAYAAMEAQGLVVGAEVVRVAGGIDRLVSRVRLGVGERVVACPTKKGTGLAPGMRQVEVAAVDLRLSLLMLNETALAGVSGEVVTNIYARLRRAAPVSDTILVSIANDRIGYIADDRAYDAPIFEVNGSPVERGYAEAAIVDGLVEMIREQIGVG